MHDDDDGVLVRGGQGRRDEDVAGYAAGVGLALAGAVIWVLLVIAGCG